MSVAMLLVAAHKLLLAATESLIRIDWKYTIKNELKSFVIHVTIFVTYLQLKRESWVVLRPSHHHPPMWLPSSWTSPTHSHAPSHTPCHVAPNGHHSPRHSQISVYMTNRSNNQTDDVRLVVLCPEPVLLWGQRSSDTSPNSWAHARNWEQPIEFQSI